MNKTENDRIILSDAQSIKRSDDNKHQKPLIPTIQHANALFNFMAKYEFLEVALSKKALFPRYNKEEFKDILHKDNSFQLYIPMKCFCDISLHMLNNHVYWYGPYAIAFSKEFCIDNKCQPMQYINPSSDVNKAFAKAFNFALKDSVKRNIKYRNELLSCLMYMKTMQGKQQPYAADKEEGRNFMDDCEWRYIPDLKEMDQVYFAGQNSLTRSTTNLLNDTLQRTEEGAFRFEYKNIKYLIVKSDDDFIRLKNFILGLEDCDEKAHLLSSVIVWDKWKGDF
jgi:hypothetical protein